MRITIFEDGSTKEFNSVFRVLRKLPYEAIIGRGDMVKHRLLLSNTIDSTHKRPWERGSGQPVLQAPVIGGAHMDKVVDPLYVRAERPTRAC